MGPVVGIGREVEEVEDALLVEASLALEVVDVAAAEVTADDDAASFEYEVSEDTVELEMVTNDEAVSDEVDSVLLDATGGEIAVADEADG